MTTPTYGQPLIQPGDIVERIDALIPRGEDGTPLAWTRGYVRGQLLLDARNEIERLRARVAVLETALRHYADDGYNGYNGSGDCARAALDAKP
jgi:hypothetical protein